MAVELRDAQLEIHRFRMRLAIAAVFVLADVRRARRAVRLPAGRPARALSHARGSEPHLDRADRSQPRHHHRPQRRGARAQLLGLHAGDHAGQGARPRGPDQRARHHRRHHAARPAALQEAAGGKQELREPADTHAAFGGGDRALRGQPLPVSRRGHQRAPVPPVSARRAVLPRGGLHRPHQRARREAARGIRAALQLSRHRSHRQGRHRAALRAAPARHDRRRGSRERRRRPRGALAVPAAPGLRQQPDPDPRRQAAGSGIPGVRRFSRRAGGDRSAHRRRCSRS